MLYSIGLKKSPGITSEDVPALKARTIRVDQVVHDLTFHFGRSGTANAERRAS